MSSAPPDPKVTAVAEQLDKLDNDLENAEEAMLSRLRAPLSRTDPAGDLADRLKKQEVRQINSLKSDSVTHSCLAKSVLVSKFSAYILKNGKNIHT